MNILGPVRRKTVSSVRKDSLLFLKDKNESQNQLKKMELELLSKKIKNEEDSLKLEQEKLKLEQEKHKMELEERRKRLELEEIRLKFDVNERQQFITMMRAQQELLECHKYAQRE